MVVTLYRQYRLIGQTMEKIYGYVWVGIWEVFEFTFKNSNGHIRESILHWVLSPKLGRLHLNFMLMLRLSFMVTNKFLCVRIGFI